MYESVVAWFLVTVFLYWCGISTFFKVINEREARKNESWEDEY